MLPRLIVSLMLLTCFALPAPAGGDSKPVEHSKAAPAVQPTACLGRRS